MTASLEELRQRRGEIYQGGGKERIEKQHAKGKLTARERLGLLLDEDTFQESNLFMEYNKTETTEQQSMPGEGVITGFGIIDNRPVFVTSQDFTVAGGSVGAASSRQRMPGDRCGIAIARRRCR